MVEMTVFGMLLAWVVVTIVMSVAASASARSAQRQEDRLRREILDARPMQAHLQEAQPADSLVRSRS